MPLSHKESRLKTYRIHYDSSLVFGNVEWWDVQRKGLFWWKTLSYHWEYTKALEAFKKAVKEQL